MAQSAFHSPLSAWFDLPPRRIVYIGTLRWTDAGVRALGRRGTWSIDDDGDTGLQTFRQRFPLLGEQVTRSVMLGETPPAR